jgi:hypothetical protein
VRPFAVLAAPWHQDVSRAGTDIGLVAAVGLPALFSVAAWHWREDRSASIRAARMVLWVVASVVPVYRLLFVGPDLQGSRYVYLAAVGWSVVLAEGLFGALGFLRRPRATLSVAVVLAAGSAALLQVHLRPWRQASVLRDAVVRAATGRMRELGCGPTTFANVPDSVRGAYVFRNGLHEALAEPGLETRGVRDCHLRWDGESFDVVPAASSHDDADAPGASRFPSTRPASRAAPGVAP